MNHIKTAILGASGYTGAELLRLLEHHPHFTITALTGDSQAGKAMHEVYPHLRHRDLPKLVKHTEVDFSKIDLVFCCLPHGTTQEIIAGLPANVKIVDLSADFRLFDVAQYAQWYGHEHRAAELQKSAAYGLTEHNRNAVRAARLVANPGCYPTSILTPLLPLVKAKLIDTKQVIANSLSGISGAGRSAKQEMLFTELDGGVSAYGVGKHRHMAEIEQELGFAISFTPHLVPMTRGMLSTIHVNGDADKIRECLENTYKNEPFVKVVATPPSTHSIRGTNLCVMSVSKGRLPNETIIVSVIDNLVKGASGQAVQNANVMFGFDETAALKLTAVFP
ncbi:MAG: N-acetyl-gamma-glutamyl-phosphate reductase [Alphaproteobacteria bacterium]|nr:N-acetyl-gamma-glutamyl-phosphate reductase [Alphaproteobacteria bacterium]